MREVRQAVYADYRRISCRFAHGYAQIFEMSLLWAEQYVLPQIFLKRRNGRRAK
jgi:hypothetical protein